MLTTIQSNGYQGIRIPDLGISLDSNGEEGDIIFVSHAHGDHIPNKPKGKDLYSTPATRKLMQKRNGPGVSSAINFHRSIDLEHATVTLYPAGHILGSAMIYIQSEQGNILYTGDYRTPAAAATEGFDCPDDVDLFITEATFALPIYRWKERDELHRQVCEFARETLDDGGTPLYLAYNLGKAQELMNILSSLDETVQIHGAGYKLCPVYEEFNIELGTYERYDRDNCEGKILIAPSSAHSNKFASHIKDLRVAYCSGWASLESRRTQLTVNELIPLSDHLDFFRLLELCQQLAPEKVYLTHTPDPTVIQYYLQQSNIATETL